MTSYQGLSTLEILEEAVNYNRWIASMFTSHISSPLLEVGSGIGNISQYFQHIDKAYFSDIDSSLVLHLKKKFPHKKHEIFALDIEKHFPKKMQNFFSAIIAINVLEHIENDSQALDMMRNGLKKNGQLFLLVPAKKIAFTRLDHDLGHFRRYEKEELVNKVEAAGFVIETVIFFNVIGLFSWIVRDKIGRSPAIKPYQIRIFDTIVPVLKVLESFHAPPLGVSLIIKARKT